MIERKIYPKLEKYLLKKEILVLIGSRRVGKTTLMKKLYDNTNSDKKKFVLFDEEINLNLFENNLDDFIELYVKNYDYLFIDEFQYAKDGGKKLKLIYDKYKIKIIISGSSAPELTIQSLQYLVGRIFIFNINPLSFEEFVKYKNFDLIGIYKKGITQKNISLFNKLFEEFLIYGGYPDIVIEENKEDKQFALKTLINTYLLKEIKDILKYKSSYEYENLLKFIAITDSTILNKSNISSDLGIYISKVNEMINVLSNTFIINILKPFQNKKIKELIKSPKIYYNDLGFKNGILNIFNPINLRVDKGAILENFILSELKKKEIENLNFYNYKNSSEVDFTFEKNAELIGIEVKSNLSGLKIERGLREFIIKYNPKEIYVYNLNVEGELKINNTKIIFTHHINVNKI